MKFNAIEISTPEHPELLKIQTFPEAKIIFKGNEITQEEFTTILTNAEHWKEVRYSSIEEAIDAERFYWQEMIPGKNWFSESRLGVVGQVDVKVGTEGYVWSSCIRGYEESVVSGVADSLKEAKAECEVEMRKLLKSISL